MDIKIDDIVKQVLSEVHTVSVRPTVPVVKKEAAFTETEKGKTAVLVSPEEYEIKEYELPKIGGKEILVHVEGCMVSPADTAEFMKEKRVGQAAVLGLEGTGTIVKVGSAGLQDAKGNVLKVGDKIVAVKKARGAVSSYRGNTINAGVTANGWFSNYVVLQAGNQVYQVNELDQESRLLTETVLAVNSVIERTTKLHKLDSTKRVLVMGCGLEGLVAMSILKCKGVDQVVAMDGDPAALKLAEEFGAKGVINYREKNGAAGVQEKIQKEFAGNMADVVFQCVSSAMGRNASKRFLKSGGYVCELGHVLGRGKATTKYYDETMPIGGRFYSAKDYEECFELLETAAQKRVPLYKLITHRFSLQEINEAHWTAVREEGMGIAVFNR